jgi:hypothetical protein
MTLGPWVHANRGAVILFAIVILVVHDLLARRGGLYVESATRHVPPWGHKFRLYVWFTAFVFFMPAVVAVARRLRLG